MVRSGGRSGARRTASEIGLHSVVLHRHRVADGVVAHVNVDHIDVLSLLLGLRLRTPLVVLRLLLMHSDAYLLVLM